MLKGSYRAMSSEGIHGSSQICAHSTETNRKWASLADTPPLANIEIDRSGLLDTHLPFWTSATSLEDMSPMPLMESLREGENESLWEQFAAHSFAVSAISGDQSLLC